MFLGSCLSCRYSTLPQFAVWQTREAWTKSDAVYSGTKGAIISFSKTLAREMARNKITVNVVCPGPTMTPLIKVYYEEDKFIRKICDTLDRSYSSDTWAHQKTLERQWHSWPLTKPILLPGRLLV